MRHVTSVEYLGGMGVADLGALLECFPEQIGELVALKGSPCCGRTSLGHLFTDHHLVAGLPTVTSGFCFDLSL
jgi:hypothetical protein